MPGPMGNPIDGTLNLQAGGNPYAGMASGGLAGLAMQYGQDYNSYLSTNKQNYDNIMKGYGTVMDNIGRTLGQGGSDWGIAQPAANQIVMQGRRAAGGAIQRSISSGLGKSTAAVAMQRGVNSDTDQALAGLGSQLAGQYAGYQSQLGSSQLGFMNSVNAPPPNAAAYSSLAQQYGTQQQQAANMAMQQQALDQQRRASNQAASRAMSGGGGGGVSIGQRPRGGPYGSGGGGFASGSSGDGALTSWGMATGGTQSSGSRSYGSSPGGYTGGNTSSIYDGPAFGGGGFDPWNPGKTDMSVYTDQDNDPYTGQDAGGHFGNTGGYLGIGWG